MRKPRRVLIGWDYGARGIWWVLSKEEREARLPKRPRFAGGVPAADLSDWG